jgi:hypothetical protein
MQKMNQFWYETYQTVTQSTFEMQGRSMQYVQNVLTDGIETLKGHIEIARHLLHSASRAPQEQQDVLETIMEGSVEFYIRNISYLQRTVERGGKVYQDNSETLHDLTQALINKAQEQQNMLWS